jgi:CarD family transcriptional regulator
MIFEVGETVVYPHHGAATITAVKTRTVKGVDKTYLTLNVHASDLMIDLPQENVELIGVRDVIDAAGVEAVFDVLRSEWVEEPGNWSRRFKANTEKMGSGSVYSVSEVVRDLWRRDQGAPNPRVRARPRPPVDRRGSHSGPRRGAGVHTGVTPIARRSEQRVCALAGRVRVRAVPQSSR